MRFPYCLPLILLLPAYASADRCEELPKPSVTVKRLDESLTFNTEYSYKSLTNLGAATARPGHQVLGLTRGNAIASFTSSSPSFFDRNGRWECVSPQITLTYGFKPMTVYVAKEFPVGSCAYQQIYEHEMRHVKTYQTHLANIEKRLSDTLTARFATGGPWRGTVGETGQRLRSELDERWLPMILREIRQVEEAQKLIDTPAEYERVANACDGEIKKLTR